MNYYIYIKHNYAKKFMCAVCIKKYKRITQFLGVKYNKSYYCPAQSSTLLSNNTNHHLGNYIKEGNTITAHYKLLCLNYLDINDLIYKLIL